MRLRGTVESGHGDASRWLGLYQAEYSRKVGWPVFPGSLNVRLTEPFDWSGPEARRRVVEFHREEYGGERDILLLPCVLSSCSGQPACLWTTTGAATGPDDGRLVEVIAQVPLRATYSLVDGDTVEIDLR